jgi:predicted nucleotidyltransferase
VILIFPPLWGGVGGGCGAVVLKPAPLVLAKPSWNCSMWLVWVMTRCYHLSAMVIQEILQQQDALAALCRKYFVQQLEVFGSAASNRFDSAKSDIDFLVTFENVPQARSFNVFFDLKDDLQLLFHREVDLLEKNAIRNPRLIRSIQINPRKVVYAAEGTRQSA